MMFYIGEKTGPLKKTILAVLQKNKGLGAGGRYQDFIYATLTSWSLEWVMGNTQGWASQGFSRIQEFPGFCLDLGTVMLYVVVTFSRNVTSEDSIIRRTTGFTLIELLVVVAIIGILASIVSANYLDALRRADDSACKQNLHSLFLAMQTYRLDYGSFPLADGVADTRPRPETTAWGCGPAANGYWTGVPLILAELGYCAESNLYCPALKRQHGQLIEAYSGCSQSAFAGKQVPQWRFLRYAYNRAALDTGGPDHESEAIGLFDVDQNAEDVWLIRCMHVDVGEFYRERDIRFPHRIEIDEERPDLARFGEHEVTVNGNIRERAVQLERR